jgi:hypothetical protein
MPEMIRTTHRFGLTPREHRISALPSTIGSVLVLAMTMFHGTVLWPPGSPQTALLLILGFLGVVYLAILTFRIIPHPRYSTSFGWIHAFLTSGGLVLLAYSVPISLTAYVGVLLVLAVITGSVISGRGPTYILITLVTLGTLAIHFDQIASLQHWTLQLSMTLLAIIILETVEQLKSLSRGHIRRLEAVAEFTRHISSTLDTHQVMALLSAAFQNAVEADTYFVGIREGAHLRLELCYDDGEYFENQRVKLEGSLSSWVLDNQRSLFLPDLRKEVDLPGVRSCWWANIKPASPGWVSPCELRTSTASSRSAPIVPTRLTVAISNCSMPWRCMPPKPWIIPTSISWWNFALSWIALRDSTTTATFWVC